MLCKVTFNKCGPMGENCCTHIVHKSRESMRPSHYSSCQSWSLILKMVNKQAHQEYRNIILRDTVKSSIFFILNFNFSPIHPNCLIPVLSFIPLCTKRPTSVTSNIRISGIILGIHIEIAIQSYMLETDAQGILNGLHHSSLDKI